MITKMFSVFDSKAAVFSTPFFMPNVGMALRSFTDLSNDQGTMVFKHPEDFALFLLAEYDDEKGVVTAVPHQNLGNAASFRKPVLGSAMPDMSMLVEKAGKEIKKSIVQNSKEVTA